MLGYAQPAPCRVPVMFHLIPIFMAIVNSLAIGKSRKSAGNLTYKTVRGRTIASQRITENKSNTAKQAAQRGSFSMSSQAIALCRSYVDYAYEKSKYGSSRNEFMKMNPKFNLGGLVSEIKEGAVTLADGFLLSIEKSGTVPRAINFVSKGSLPAIVTGQQKVVASYTYGGQTYENINAWDLDGDGMSVTFPNPVKVSDVQIVVIGFGNRSIDTAVGTIDATGNFALDGDSQLVGSAVTSRAFLSDDGQFVERINFVLSLTGGATGKYGCAIALPIVSGKTITTTAAWLHTTAAGG